MFQYSVFTRFLNKQIGDDKCSKILFSKKKTRTFFPEQLFHFCGSHHICVSIRQGDCIDTYRLPSVSILYRYGLYRPSPKINLYRQKYTQKIFFYPVVKLISGRRRADIQVLLFFSMTSGRHRADMPIQMSMWLYYN